MFGVEAPQSPGPELTRADPPPGGPRSAGRSLRGSLRGHSRAPLAPAPRCSRLLRPLCTPLPASLLLARSPDPQPPILSHVPRGPVPVCSPPAPRLSPCAAAWVTRAAHAAPSRACALGLPPARTRTPKRPAGGAVRTGAAKSRAVRTRTNPRIRPSRGALVWHPDQTRHSRLCPAGVCLRSCMPRLPMATQLLPSVRICKCVWAKNYIIDSVWKMIA